MDGNKNSGAGGAVGEKGAMLCPEAQIRAGMTDNKQTSAAIGRMGGGKMGREDRKKAEGGGPDVGWTRSSVSSQLNQVKGLVSATPKDLEENGN